MIDQTARPMSMVIVKPLPPKLEAVLIRLARNGPINMTHAVKLPYLVDVVANHVLGRPITEGHHEAWKWGVVTSEAWRYLSDADKDSNTPFQVDNVPFAEEKRITVNPGVSDDDLTADERRVVDFITAEYTTVWAKDLGQVTKLMNPEILSWGSTNHAADIGPDAYDRMSPEYQEMAMAACGWTLDRLRQSSEPLTDIEDAIA